MRFSKEEIAKLEKFAHDHEWESVEDMLNGYGRRSILDTIYLGSDD